MTIQELYTALEDFLPQYANWSVHLVIFDHTISTMIGIEAPLDSLCNDENQLELWGTVQKHHEEEII